MGSAQTITFQYLWNIRVFRRLDRFARGFQRAPYTETVRFAPHFAPRFRVALPVDDPSARALFIPGYRQVRGYTCGYTCALMVLRYFGADILGRELYEGLGTTRDGTRQTALIRALRDAGLSVNARYDFDFARLRQSVDNGKLVIAYHYPLEHWIVLYGYGQSPRRAFVADPRPQEPCVHQWDQLVPHVRQFGIVCSRRDFAEPSEPRYPWEPAARPDGPDGIDGDASGKQLAFEL